MKIYNTSWHYRFLERTHNTWMKNYSDLDPKEYHNLCPYLRAVLLYCPAVWILGSIYVAVSTPILWVGDQVMRLYHWIYWQYALRTYVIVDGKIVEVASFWYPDLYTSTDDLPRWAWYKLRIKPPKQKTVKVKTGTPMRELIGAWYEGRHEKFCPAIEIVDGKGLNNPQANVKV